MARRHSLATKFSIGVALIILAVVAIASVTTGFFFSRNCRESFYASALGSIAEFSESISMFFNAKETELKVFSECDEVMAADETIHSFVNETESMKLSMDEMGMSTGKINDSGKALSEISSLMKDSISDIGKQVDQFTV